MAGVLSGDLSHLTAEWQTGWSDNALTGRVILCHSSAGQDLHDPMWNDLKRAAVKKMETQAMRQIWDGNCGPSLGYFSGFFILGGATTNACAHGCFNDYLTAVGMAKNPHLDACHYVRGKVVLRRKIATTWVSDRETAVTICEGYRMNCLLSGMQLSDKVLLARWILRAIAIHDVDRDVGVNADAPVVIFSDDEVVDG